MMYLILYVSRAFSVDYGIFPSLKYLWDQLQDDTCSDNCKEMRSEVCFKSVLTKNIKNVSRPLAEYSNLMIVKIQHRYYYLKASFLHSIASAHGQYLQTRHTFLDVISLLVIQSK